MFLPRVVPLLRSSLVALMVLMLGPVKGASQDNGLPWETSYFPYVLGNPTDGIVLLVRWQYYQKADYYARPSKGAGSEEAEPKINPIAYTGSLGIEAGAGTLGSWFTRVEFRAPDLVPGWRLAAGALAERRGRFGYYGVGGDLDSIDPGTDANDNRYRVHRRRLAVQADLTRQLFGGLRVALGGWAERYQYDALEGITRFASHHGSRLIESRVAVRPALVFDIRNRELSPDNGLLLEAGLGISSGADTSLGTGSSYGFRYAHGRGYISPRAGTVLAARGLIQTLDDEAPLSATFTVPSWESDMLLSGTRGHRSYPAGAIAARKTVLGSVEVRHDLLNLQDLGAITLFAFSDYVRSEDDRAEFSPVAEHFGGGGGFAVRILRASVTTVNFAGGSHGFTFSMGSSWTF